MAKNNKIGFLHIPRTGGTYLESVLVSMGPERFFNFFGTPNNQIVNKIGIIEYIENDNSKCNRILNNPNWQTCELFSGHFSRNIDKCIGHDNVEYMTVLREPIQRTTSFVKRVTSSKGFSRAMMKNDSSINSDGFWLNFESYIKEGSKLGLRPHERHGFSNYMTKVIAGENLCTEVIDVNSEVLKRAKNNLKDMIYVGRFEEYSKTVKDILSLFNVDSRFQDRGLQTSIIPYTTKTLISSINEYDTELYQYFMEEIWNNH